jgi:hypothetical protein
MVSQASATTWPSILMRQPRSPLMAKLCGPLWLGVTKPVQRIEVWRAWRVGRPQLNVALASFTGGDRRAGELEAGIFLRLQALGRAGGVLTEDGVRRCVAGRPDQAGPLDIGDLGVREAGADAGQHGDRLRRRAVVVADQGVDAVGVGTDHGDRLRRGLQRQQAVVLQQHHRGLLGRLQRQGPVGGGVVVGGGDLAVGPGPGGSNRPRRMRASNSRRA